MSGNQSHLAKKAHEIAYAIFRIAPQILEKTLAAKMTAEATEVLASAVARNDQQAIKSLEALNYFIKFATELNFISFINGEVLMREIGNFQAAIAESVNAATATKGFDAAEYFASLGLVPVAEFKAQKKENTATGNSGNIIKSGMRQIAILDRIRESGNCRLRDIQEILPDTSERTIRYDLEDLMERNIIERIGNGGPSVSYRIRQLV